MLNKFQICVSILASRLTEVTMIIDTHSHENKYSFDSHMELLKGIKQAKKVGLDALCITNHDNNTLAKEIGDSTYIDGILVIVGTEILTTEGDILTFGIKDIPDRMLSSEELLTYVRRKGGVSIAAHPFRKNHRGLGNHIRKVHHLLDGIEAFNGSTPMYLNLEAYTLSTELNIPSFGGSDSHIENRVGLYATKFYENIKNHMDFVEAIKSKTLHPTMLSENGFKDIDYSFNQIIAHKKAI